MTNSELVLELNDCVIHPSRNTNLADMLQALDEYLHLVPGRNNSIPTFKRIAAMDQLVIVKVVNAWLYCGYKPKPLTTDEKELYHPEREPWQDGLSRNRADYLVYLDFLEKAIESLGRRKPALSV